MKPIYLRIAEELGVREQQVAAAISSLDGGATVTFVARYRKEATGELDDTQLRTLGELVVDRPMATSPSRKPLRLLLDRGAVGNSGDRCLRPQSAGRLGFGPADPRQARQGYGSTGSIFLPTRST
jgi:hypothetical protein